MFALNNKQLMIPQNLDQTTLRSSSSALVDSKKTPIDLLCTVLSAILYCLNDKYISKYVDNGSTYSMTTATKKCYILLYAHLSAYIKTLQI